MLLFRSPGSFGTVCGAGGTSVAATDAAVPACMVLLHESSALAEGATRCMQPFAGPAVWPLRCCVVTVHSGDNALRCEPHRARCQKTCHQSLCSRWFCYGLDVSAKLARQRWRWHGVYAGHQVVRSELACLPCADARSMHGSWAWQNTAHGCGNRISGVTHPAGAVGLLAPGA